jgi:hypothetical protein
MPMTAEQAEEVWANPHLTKLLEMEASLEGK